MTRNGEGGWTSKLLTDAAVGECLGGGWPERWEKSVFCFYFENVTFIESISDLSILLLGSLVWLLNIKTVLMQSLMARCCCEPAEWGLKTHRRRSGARQSRSCLPASWALVLPQALESCLGHSDSFIYLFFLAQLQPWALSSVRCKHPGLEDQRQGGYLLSLRHFKKNFKIIATMSV